MGEFDVNVQTIINEGMSLLPPELPHPQVKIVNNAGSRWLGRTEWNYGVRNGQPFCDDTTLITLQKRILSHEETLRRVIFHEVCHHWNILIDDKKDLEKMGLHTFQFYHKTRQAHGKQWHEYAAIFNNRFGKDFVTEKSDENYVEDMASLPEYLLLLYRQPNGHVHYEMSMRTSPKQKQWLEMHEGHPEYRLVRTKEPEFIRGPSIGSGRWGYPRTQDQDKREKLQALWAEAPVSPPKTAATHKKLYEDREGNWVCECDHYLFWENTSGCDRRGNYVPTEEWNAGYRSTDIGYRLCHQCGAIIDWNKMKIIGHKSENYNLFAAKIASVDELDNLPDAAIISEPGTRPIPAGTIRLFHYTGGEGINEVRSNLASIMDNGLGMQHAKGENYGEPNMVWGSTEEPRSFKYFVEFWAKPDEFAVGGPGRNATQQEIDNYQQGNHDGALRISVPPERIIAVHEPWHHAYRYIANDKEFQGEIREGKMNYLLDPNGRWYKDQDPDALALRYWVQRHPEDAPKIEKTAWQEVMLMLSERENDEPAADLTGGILEDDDDIQEWIMQRVTDLKTVGAMKKLLKGKKVAEIDQMNAYHRGAGWGTKLMNAFVARAKAAGCDAIVLEAGIYEHQNKGFDLVEWYESLGFRIVGQSIDLPIMVKWLKPQPKKAAEPKEPSKNATVQVNIPKELAWKVQKIAEKIIPADDLAGDGYEKQSHITLRYGILTEDKNAQ